MGLTPILLLVLALILWAEFVNGWTDAANAIATVVSTRVLSPKRAVLLATAGNILGALSGTAVAETIGRGIIRPDEVTLTTVAAAMVGIIAWSTLAWKYGLPTSESHALVSGLAGSALATGGPSAILTSGWMKVGVGLLLSTFLGFVGAFLLFKFLGALFAQTGISKVRRWFGRAQLSTTHTISTSIMGVVAAQKRAGVRMQVAGNIVAAWILTFPICGALAYLITKLVLLIT